MWTDMQKIPPTVHTRYVLPGIFRSMHRGVLRAGFSSRATGISS